MAPETRAPRFLLVFYMLLTASFILPQSVSAAPLPPAPALPDLSSFASSIRNGNGKMLRGVYADGLLALQVVQQPSSNAGYVSTADNTATQFGLAAQFGNIGLLAHDYLSGQYFSQIGLGEKIDLIYGDGRIEGFRVSHIYRYQAESPFSVASNFIDLDSHEYLTANGLFNKVYRGSRHVTFQTCILKDGNSSWGRLFVIADPAPLTSSDSLLN